MYRTSRHTEPRLVFTGLIVTLQSLDQYLQDQQSHDRAQISTIYRTSGRTIETRLVQYIGLVVTLLEPRLVFTGLVVTRQSLDEYNIQNQWSHYRDYISTIYLTSSHTIEPRLVFTGLVVTRQSLDLYNIQQSHCRLVLQIYRNNSHNVEPRL